VGQYALQVLRYWGYRRVIATASQAQHATLVKYGAIKCFDYRSPNVVKNILSWSASSNELGPSIPFILDCIGSKDGTLAPEAKLAVKGTRVAIMLPVIVKHASTGEPEYSLEAQGEADWAKGVIVRGVRTHFYLQVSFHSVQTQSGKD